jgi:hypothetical protein
MLKQKIFWFVGIYALSLTAFLAVESLFHLIVFLLQ